MYGVYHGADGLRQIASRVAHTAATLAARASGPRLEPFGIPTISIRSRSTATPAAGDLRRALARGINLRRPTEIWRSAATRRRRRKSSKRVWGAFGSKGSRAERGERSLAAVAEQVATAIPAALRRTTTFMNSSSVFVEHRSETEMMRYFAASRGS